MQLHRAHLDICSHLISLIWQQPSPFNSDYLASGNLVRSMVSRISKGNQDMHMLWFTSENLSSTGIFHSRISAIRGWFLSGGLLQNFSSRPWVVYLIWARCLSSTLENASRKIRERPFAFEFIGSLMSQEVYQGR